MKKLFFLIVALFIWTASLSWSADYLDNYRMINADLTGTTLYLQYSTMQGAWYIKALDQTTTNAFRVTFIKASSGDTDYVTGWTNKDTGVSPYKAYELTF